MTATGFPAFPATRRKPGRGFAYAGLVGPITVSPGRIAAQVTNDDGAVHHTVVLVDRLSAEQWQRFLDEVAAKAGHLAALLDRDMPHDRASAVQLLPGIGDPRPGCNCDGWELPCTHAAELRGRAEKRRPALGEPLAPEAVPARPLTVPPAPGIDPAALAALVARPAERARKVLYGQ